MAQDFERNIARENGSADAGTELRTADSDDALVGISLANIISTQILVDVWIEVSSNKYYLGYQIPLPAGASLQLLDGGAKVVMQSGDVLRLKSDTANSLDAWVSVVDSIST